MLSIIGSLIGFASSAVPAITDSFKDKADKKHEIEKMKTFSPYILHEFPMNKNYGSP